MSMMIFIFAAVVAPRFGNFVPALRVERAAREIIAAGMKARADAALKGRIVRLVVDSEERTFQLTIQENPFKDPDTYKPPPGSWSEPLSLPDRVEFESLEGASEDEESGLSYFEFKPDGTATEGSVVITNEKGDEKTIRIEKATARVYVDEDDEEE